MFKYQLSQIIEQKYSLEEIRQISKKLNKADEYPENKLDCSNVFGVEDDILEAIFSGIKKEWSALLEIDNFMTGVNGDLRKCIDIFIKNRRPKPTLINKFQQPKVYLMFIGIIGIFLIGLYLRKEQPEISNQIPPQSEITCLPNEKLEDGQCYKDLAQNSIAIGVLGRRKKEKYQQLESYLENKLGIDFKIDASDISYAEVRDKIATKEWDLVFVASPISSISAQDNDYTWIAKMYPNNPPYYQSALYVKADSLINSIEDINSSHIIALGYIGSVSSFYLPIYQLYGKTLNVYSKSLTENVGSLRDLVKNGIVDISSGTASESLKNSPEFKIIAISPDIPGGGVYISPKIYKDDQQKIQSAMLNAPENIRKDANYGEGKEPNYTEFRKISLRAEEIIQCSDLFNNPVPFYCKCSATNTNRIKGIVNGFTKVSNEEVRLNLVDQETNLYEVYINLKILAEVKGGTTPILINKKNISLLNAEAKKLDSKRFEVKITNSNQIEVGYECDFIPTSNSSSHHISLVAQNNYAKKVKIFQIQGENQESLLLNETVITEGIVTAVKKKAFISKIP